MIELNESMMENRKKYNAIQNGLEGLLKTYIDDLQ